MKRKAITALIGNTLFIDPIDKDNVNVEAMRATVEPIIQERMHVSYMPINAWMPKTGTKAIMDAAIKKLNAK